jgi:DNA-binding PadR family transcriptional regulator
MLEDLGYARGIQEEAGRKIYEITPEGKAYLAENKNTVDDIFARIAEFGSSFFSGAMMEVNQAFKNVGRATYSSAPRHMRDVERLRKIKEALERAAKEIEEIGR